MGIISFCWRSWILRSRRKVTIKQSKYFQGIESFLDVHLIKFPLLYGIKCLIVLLKTFVPYLEARESIPIPPTLFLQDPSQCFFTLMLSSVKKTSSLKFPHQNVVCISSFPKIGHLPSPFYSSWLEKPNVIRWGVKIVRFLIAQFSSLSCYFIALIPNTYHPQQPILEYLQPIFFSQQWEAIILW